MFDFIFGLANNLFEHNKEKEFIANHDYGYAGIMSVDEAINGVDKTVDEIKIYMFNENLNLKLFTGILIYSSQEMVLRIMKDFI